MPQKLDGKNLTLNLLGKKMHLIDPRDTQFMLKEMWLLQPYRIQWDASVNHIIDVGANQGFSMLYFRNQHPTARITAVEVHPDNFKILAQNAKQMNVHGDVLINKAAWKDETLLYMDFTENTASTNHAVKEENTFGTPVSAFDFGSWLQKNPADIVKIDIEGAEVEVLESVWNAEAMNCSRHWLIEFHTERQGQILHSRAVAAFSKAGFTYENRGIVGYFYK